MRLTWTIFALRDREAILEYIAADNAQAAIATDDRIEAQAELLIHSPELGRSGRIPGTRELVITERPTSLPIVSMRTASGYFGCYMELSSGRAIYVTNPIGDPPGTPRNMSSVREDIPVSRVPHLHDSFTVVKVGNRAKRDRSRPSSGSRPLATKVGRQRRRERRYRQTRQPSGNHQSLQQRHHGLRYWKHSWQPKPPSPIAPIPSSTSPAAWP